MAIRSPLSAFHALIPINDLNGHFTLNCFMLVREFVAFKDNLFIIYLFIESDHMDPYTEHINGKTDRHNTEQESRAIAKKLRDAAAVLFGLKFADDIHYKFKSTIASKARPQNSKHTGAKQNVMQNGDSRSCFLESVERRQGTK